MNIIPGGEKYTQTPIFNYSNSFQSNKVKKRILKGRLRNIYVEINPENNLMPFENSFDMKIAIKGTYSLKIIDPYNVFFTDFPQKLPVISPPFISHEHIKDQTLKPLYSSFN